MYEIWLALNIVWEIARAVWPGLLVAALVWLFLMALALRHRGTPWRVALAPALWLGGVVALIAFLAVPGWTRSSLGELGYWVDWLNLLAIALGIGAGATAYAWPVLALRGRGTA